MIDPRQPRRHRQEDSELTGRGWELNRNPWLNAFFKAVLGASLPVIAAALVRIAQVWGSIPERVEALERNSRHTAALHDTIRRDMQNIEDSLAFIRKTIVCVNLPTRAERRRSGCPASVEDLLSDGAHEGATDFDSSFSRRNGGPYPP